jgi:hypothetical protein
MEIEDYSIVSGYRYYACIAMVYIYFDSGYSYLEYHPFMQVSNLEYNNLTEEFEKHVEIRN